MRAMVGRCGWRGNAKSFGRCMHLVVDYGRLSAEVDDCHTALLVYAWRTDRYGYVYRKSAGRRIYLHHVVCGKPPMGMVTDHRDRNKLNNVSDNLRHVSEADSHMNVGAQRRNASGIRGANWDKANGKWKSSARLNGKLHCFGYHETAELAGRAASDWRKANMPASYEGGGAH